LVDAASTYVASIVSPGADAGLCVGDEQQVSSAVVDWGRRAKQKVLSAEKAHAIAAAAGLRLVGLTGDESGGIGALAAARRGGGAGVRRSDSDGRFLELVGLRGLVGEQPVAALLEAGLERFLAGGREVELAPTELIVVGDKHAQPVLLEGLPTLLLDPGSETG